MYTPERRGYEPAIVTGTPVKGRDIRQWEPTIKENINTPNNNNKYISYQKHSTPIRAWINETTSLTPLIEKHSIRDEVNPFYQASESDIAETPGMIVTPNSSYTTFDETPSRMYSIQSKLDDEMRRMEQLHEDLLEIKEQCSFLASRSTSASKAPSSLPPATPLKEIPSWRTRTPIEERRSAMDSYPYKIQKTTHTPLRTSLKSSIITTTTPSRHISVHKEKTPSFKEQNNTPFNTNNNNKKQTPSSSKRIGEKTTPLVTTPYHRNNNNNNNDNNNNTLGTELKTPDNSTQEFLDQISSAKLRSTEIIRTPGGSRVANKFWREIHGHNNRSNPSSSPSSPLSPSSYPKSPTKLSTMPKGAIPPPPPPPPPPPQSMKRTWKDNEEEFWSETSPQPSTFNNRLFKAAQEERIMSLEDELNSAAQKEESNRPRLKANTDMIAELKARHKDKYLDDSDSYKFA